MSPVVYFHSDKLEKMTMSTTSNDASGAGILFCRTLFSKVKDNKVYAQSAIALGVAASAFGLLRVLEH